MKYERVDPGHEAPFLEVPLEIDRQFRANPEVVTTLLREQIPVLDFVQWRVSSLLLGSAESVVPLNVPSTNQHFTHQAALFLLAADYTGGIAIASLMTGWPVVGVHPVTSPKSIALWLLKGEIKYMRPSVADLTVSAEVDPARHARLVRRFLSGKPLIESVPVYFKNGDTVVGEATLTYFARQSEKLRSEGVSGDKVNILYELKLTSSAELIAGVRAQESGTLFDDPYAAEMAGEHGVALATRFCERSPQLGGMVAARTRHLDDQIGQFLAAGGRDVVLLGVGWDMRPFRLPLPEGTRIFELDFPTTLAERGRRIKELGLKEPPGVTRVELPIDLRTMSLASVLEDHADAEKPLLIAWEGMSMYFQEEEINTILDGMTPLLKHPESLLWVDLVDREAVEHPEKFPSEVQEFMRGMQILGEPFTFGVDSVEEFMAENGFRCREAVSSDVFLDDNRDPVYSAYQFCVASAASAAQTAGDGSQAAVRLDAGFSVPAVQHVRGNGRPNGTNGKPASKKKRTTK